MQKMTDIFYMVLDHCKKAEQVFSIVEGLGGQTVRMGVVEPMYIPSWIQDKFEGHLVITHLTGLNMRSLNKQDIPLFEKYGKMVDWQGQCWHLQSVDCEFAERFKNELCWVEISVKCRFSKKFARKFKDRLSWDDVIRHHRLSDSSLVEFSQHINWERMAHRLMKFSPMHIREVLLSSFQDLSKLRRFTINVDCTEDFLDACLYLTIGDVRRTYILLHYTELSPEFIEKWLTKYKSLRLLSRMAVVFEPHFIPYDLVKKFHLVDHMRSMSLWTRIQLLENDLVFRNPE